MAVIEVHGLRKSYRRRGRPPLKALDGVDLVVDGPGVHGFLGPNGSGKTTTIRVLLGLVRADAGEVRLLGRPVPRGLPEVVADVGALVETPLFFPAFSGRLNLRLLARTAGLSDTRVEEVLETVDLRDRAAERFRGYSLGMKQRLGIAAALLKRPRLLVLDEPSNGLDPAGIRAVRELIRRLGADGRTTVFLSSHLLAEIEQVCDAVSIMARGTCVASGTVAAVLAGRSAGEVSVRVPDLAGAREVLVRAGHRVSEAGGSLRVSGVPDPGVVTRLLGQSGHWVTELTPVQADLEQTFLELTAAGPQPAPESRPAQDVP